MKVHGRAWPSPWSEQTTCGTAGTTGDDVTCLRCLYRMGLYVPLVKLREHQDTQSAGRAKYGKRDPFYHFDRVHQAMFGQSPADSST